MISDGRPHDLDNRVAASVGRLVTSCTGGPIAPATDRSSFDVLERRLAARRRRTRMARVSVLAAAALVVGGYLGAGQFFGAGPAVLTYRVGGGPSLKLDQAGGVLDSAAAGAGTSVAFSDGSSLHLEPRTRGRVVELDPRGGRVVLDGGRARVEVRPRPNARWFFQAGPFEVRVHGTAFSLGWDPGSAHFDLHMENGVVSVAGPLSGGEIVLRAGESLSIGLHETHGAGTASTSSPPGPRDGAGAHPAATPAVESVRPGARVRRLDEAPSIVERTGAPTGWREELGKGHAGAVVADARRRGFARVLESESSDDLAALADAARFIGSDGLARRVLLAQRRRFPRSSRAAEASFLLGRLEDESPGGGARALDWYDRYLVEAPAGAYVSETLGRKMMALERSRRRDEAVAVASDYLERFPAGSYAHAATALVERMAAPGEAPLPRGR